MSRVGGHGDLIGSAFALVIAVIETQEVFFQNPVFCPFSRTGGDSTARLQPLLEGIVDS